MHYYITTALQQFSYFGSRRLLALFPLNKTLLQIWINLYIQIELDDELRLDRRCQSTNNPGYTKPTSFACLHAAFLLQVPPHYPQRSANIQFHVCCVSHGAKPEDSQQMGSKSLARTDSAIDAGDHKPDRLWQIWGLHMCTDRRSRYYYHPHLGLSRQIWNWCLMPCSCHSYFYHQGSWKLRFCCMCHG